MNTEKIYDENEIITLVSQGNEHAFAKLFEHHQNKIYGVALNITHSTTLAEEIVEDVFFIIWTRRSTLLEIQNFNAYLFTITRNHVYKSLKQIAKNFQTVPLTENYQTISPDSADDYTLDKEYTSILHEAVTRLPKQQKEVYSLIKEHGLKREEAASVLNLKPETIKFHLAEAMKNIRSFCVPRLDMIMFIIFSPFYTS
ncbi:MAG: sigma-70 family RNA polymerase sigma factor [Ginsengibacter sp.]